MVLFLLTLGIPLRAQDARTEVVKLFSDTQPKADFIFVVDASRSMLPLFQELRRVLPTFISELQDGDHVSVIRFSNEAVEAIPDQTLGTKSRQALEAEIAQLAEPARTDTKTDLRAAFERTLLELNRPDFSPVQVVIFVSDFCNEPPGMSEGCKPLEVSSLRQQAGRILQGHQIRVIALALPGTSTEGIEALQQVLPNVLRVDTSLGQLDEYFARLKKEVVYEKTAAQAFTELAQGKVLVQAKEGEISCPYGETRPIALQVSQNMAHLTMSVRIQDARLTGGPGGRLSFDEAPILIPPNRVVTVTGQISLPPRDQPWALARKISVAKALEATLFCEALPEEGLRQLNVDPALRNQDVRVSIGVTSEVGRSLWLFSLLALGIVGVPLLVVMLLVCKVRRAKPVYLKGTLKAWSGAVKVLEIDLAARRCCALTIGAKGCDVVLAQAGADSVRLAAGRHGWCGSLVIYTAARIGGAPRLQSSRLAGEVPVSAGANLMVGECNLRWDW
jgi:hypothetical protein